jgi:hypothetical protein
MFLAPPNPFREPIDIGPEPTEPSESMKPVMTFARVVHLACLVERARRAADEATLYALSKVYDPELEVEFGFAESTLQGITNTLSALHATLSKSLKSSGTALSSRVSSSPSAGPPGSAGAA